MSKFLLIQKNISIIRIIFLSVVPNRKPNEFSVYAASANRLLGGTEHTVSRGYPYPYYNKTTHAYDIIIFKLNTPFSLNGKTLKAISLAPRNSDVAPNTEVEISGWGRMTTTGAIPVYLRGVSVVVIHRDRCKEAFPVVRTDTIICAYNTIWASCAGDSGGPMVLNGVLVGIVNGGGIGCAISKKPAFYASIGLAEIRDFIRSVTNM